MRPETVPFRIMQIDVLPSFRHGVPESRGQGWSSSSASTCPESRHSPGIPCRGSLWRNDDMCKGMGRDPDLNHRLTPRSTAIPGKESNRSLSGTRLKSARITRSERKATSGTPAH